MGSGVSTTFISESSNELYDRLKLLLKQKQAGNNSDRTIEEIVAIADNLLEYKCIYMKQHNSLLLKSLN